MFSYQFPRAHREVVRDSNVEIVRDFDSRGRATDVWFRFNNYVVFALEVKHDQLGRIHQWRRKVRFTCTDFHLTPGYIIIKSVCQTVSSTFAEPPDWFQPATALTCRHIILHLRTKSYNSCYMFFFCKTANFS